MAPAALASASTEAVDGSSGRWKLALPALRPGTYVVVVQAADEAGNQGHASLTLHLRGSA